VAKPALGIKRICSGCGAKFYDLDHTPIVCPTCETVFLVPKAAPQRARSANDPRSQPARPMGTLKEDAPAIAEGTEAKDDTQGGVPMLEEIDEE
jgi:uncharacterized protein (TIGR02300 family)